jgi:hypothetical protein
MSTYSKVSKSTRRSIGATSIRTSRTYTSQLEKQLLAEKRAREKLQVEVE